jgi:putative glutamine amidotransferase
MSKLIAITGGVEDVAIAPGVIPCSVLNMAFIELCNSHGAEAIVIPPQALNINFSNISFDRLIISGGGDINPIRYGQEVGIKSERILDERDNTELNLLKIAENNSIKTLGICRGHQLLNVYKGGTLHQDISSNIDTNIEHMRLDESSYKHIHKINIKENTKLSSITQNQIVDVNSIHHQVINVLGENLKINALSEDGLIEGIETTSEWQALGIQWHPENLLTDEITHNLINWLLE